ncbi:hypothetical protein EDC01DRAFT_483276 [Geopyxis carbonaria]|nr:hypothetical protein EDC01DRAFT_483276 [Geopyxis carbonaria]
MKFCSVLSVLGLAIGAANAQSSSAYTDSVTGITFQRFYTESYSFSFGMALPEAPTDQFIGQLVAPIAGWSGVSLGGGMIDNLLLTAWANADEIIRGFRLTGVYELPTEYKSSTLTPDPVLTPLACGTSINSTHISLTFTCTNCNYWENSYAEVGGFDLAADFTVMGWAYNPEAPVDPADPQSEITQHTGFGQYGMILASARSADYDAWISACGAEETPTPTTTPAPTSAPATTTTVVPTSTAPAGHWQQCGGLEWTGTTKCASPYKCTKLNDYYWQCL